MSPSVSPSGGPSVSLVVSPIVNPSMSPTVNFLIIENQWMMKDLQEARQRIEQSIGSYMGEMKKEILEKI